ncbi:MAG: hypothetical protein Q7T41_00600 [Candidatus Saccharibacteria bacterium]|nr:hypothetical protein [Candidatus Saccharibacteria bacterium]
MKKQQIKAGISAAVIGLLSPLAMVVPASAASKTWDGHKEGFGNNYVSSDYNWVGDVAPSSGDVWHFPGSGVSQTIDIDVVDVADPVDIGGIFFDGDYTGISEKSYTLMDEAIELLGNIEATMTGNGGNHDVGVDITLKADVSFKTSGSNSLSVGTETSTLGLGANDLTLDASGGTISLFGKVTGSGNIVKSGTGKVQISTVPGTGGYTGSVTLSAGDFNANGTLGAVSISGGTLKGTGTVGAVSMSSGSIAPGNSPGTLNTGTVTLTGGTHAVELGGKAAGEFDKLNVVGDVDLGSATDLSISLVNSFTPAVNDSFVIIDNDGTDAVKGAFKGLADGEKVTLSSYTYQINYDGGTGNDVVLLVTGTPSAPDTGVGSLIGNPVGSLLAALLVAGSVVGYRYFEIKKARR